MVPWLTQTVLQPPHRNLFPQFAKMPNHTEPEVTLKYLAFSSNPEGQQKLVKADLDFQITNYSSKFIPFIPLILSGRQTESGCEKHGTISSVCAASLASLKSITLALRNKLMWIKP